MALEFPHPPWDYPMTKTAPPKVHWIRSNGFLLGLLLAVVVAFLLPGRDRAEGCFTRNS